MKKPPGGLIRSPAKDDGRRFHELDSMRGLAAVVVLVHHFRNMFYPSASFQHGWQSVLLYPFVSGHESVIFFFLLSGFVLSLPFLRGKIQPYRVYIWRRVLRIYGPYLGALVLSVVGCALWHNRLGATGWASITWFAPVSLRSIGHHILFIGNYDDAQYNTAFWSLVHEMRISLIFPHLFVAAARLSAKYTLLVVASCTLVGVHAVEYRLLATVEYAGIFLVGALIAKNLRTLSELYKRIGTSQQVLLALISFLLYVKGHHLANVSPLWHLGELPITLGAAGFLIIGLNSTIVSRILNSPIPTFLGRISYSFYLLHGTVLFAMAVMLKDRLSCPVFFLIYFSTTILLSWGFYVAVEKPFMLMSRNAGRRKSTPIVRPPLAAD